MTNSGDLERLGSLVPNALGEKMPAERRVAMVWSEVVGAEVARNAQPRTLRAGRLVVATSSSVWAQTLQNMAGEITARLNRALNETQTEAPTGAGRGTSDRRTADEKRPSDIPLVREMVFRPAGWDPGAAAGAAPALDGASGGRYGGSDGWGTKGTEERPAEGRRLTAEEESAVDAVRRGACDSDLGERISRAMRASLERASGPSEK